VSECQKIRNQYVGERFVKLILSQSEKCVTERVKLQDKQMKNIYERFKMCIETPWTGNRN